MSVKRTASLTIAGIIMLAIVVLLVGGRDDESAQGAVEKKIASTDLVEQGVPSTAGVGQRPDVVDVMMDEIAEGAGTAVDGESAAPSTAVVTVVEPRPSEFFQV